MEIFDVHRRDILDFDRYMDLKKPGFGGPASAKPLRDGRGKKINADPRLAEYQRTVERDPAFSHPVWNSTYKAMTHDLVYKQEKKKPFTYADPYLTGLPVVELEDSVEEGQSFTSFEAFVNESTEVPLSEIEATLRSYEEDEDEEYTEFGANPMEEIPDMPEDIRKWIETLDADNTESEQL
jgi:hypothetical protein